MLPNNHHFSAFAKRISALYDFGEAQSITKIIQEDVFQNRASDKLSTAELKQLKQIEAQLLEGIPIQYILGQADFYGLKLKVSPAVLIPRQETESLVYEIIKFAQARKSSNRIKIIDIGTGSGCIALALKKEIGAADITAVDISIEALNIARSNNQENNLCVQFEQLDILDSNQWKRMKKYDIIVSNPPYIPPSEKDHMPDYVKDHEPHLALFVEEENPMIFYRKIALFAKEHLAENGLLAFEVNEFRAVETANLLKEIGFRITIKKDLSGADRVVLGIRK